MTTRRLSSVRRWWPFVFATFLTGCGGSGGAPPSAPSSSPSPSPSPQQSFQNPCLSVSASSLDTSAAPSSPKANPGVFDADPRGTIFDVLWDHRAAVANRARSALPPNAPRATADSGDIAVIQDDGDLVMPSNPFDLREAGLRAVPNAAGGYDVSRIDAGFRPTLGNRLILGDDDSVAANVPFAFTFFGQNQSAAFVNSDGNITFGEADRASTARNIARLMTGAPRVAPFLADLDPSAGGGVFLSSATDAFTATWCGVRVFGSTLTATFQTSLLPDGSIEMKYADATSFTATDGVVGVSPGRTSTFLPVDLSTAAPGAPLSSGTGALAERFALRSTLDLVATARKFYLTHADAYDQLVVWTDAPLTPPNAFSFEVTVANEIAGIGMDRFNAGSEFGSSGQLRSMVQMDNIAKFPDDPATKFLGENTTVSVMGQEVGHRWLALLRFSDHNRQPSGALLGRDQAHWSFFFNSDASVMEGNRIQDLGGGLFRTIAAVEKYSLLDQYAMGLVRDIDVPPFFYVESPLNVQPSATAVSAPRIGVTFNGTRRDVLIDDVIEVMGRRDPSAADAPKVVRQAFVFVVSRGRTADAIAIAKIDRIRRAWQTFFGTATDGRGRVETRLVAASPLP